jgi:hypothetical protein
MAERPTKDRRAPWWGVALLAALTPAIVVLLLLRVTWSLCLHVVVWCWWLPRGLAVLRHVDGVSLVFENVADQLPDVRFVIHDQDVRLGHQEDSRG